MNCDATEVKTQVQNLTDFEVTMIELQNFRC